MSMTQTNCKHCGTIIPAGAMFCPECGLPVSSAEVNQELQPAIPNPDSGTNGYANTVKLIEQARIFSFFSGFINSIETSAFFKQPLRWLYILFAVLNILVPIYLLFMMISNDMLNSLGAGGFMLWVVVAFAGWMGFLLWWNRKDKIGLYYQKGDDFFAIPLFSHYIQTTGEWFGITIAIIGAGSSLIAWFFLSGNSRDYNIGIPLPLQNLGIAGVIVSPILGFTIILATKVLSELYRALAAIANNTRQMALRK